MSDQDLMNILFGIVIAGGAWWMRTMWDNLKDLQKANESNKTLITTEVANLSGRIAEIEILVAGNYMPRPEFERSIDALFKKLDKIEDKLDRKADKP